MTRASPRHGDATLSFEALFRDANCHVRVRANSTLYYGHVWFGDGATSEAHTARRRRVLTTLEADVAGRAGTRRRGRCEDGEPNRTAATVAALANACRCFARASVPVKIIFYELAAVERDRQPRADRRRGRAAGNGHHQVRGLSRDDRHGDDGEARRALGREEGVVAVGGPAEKDVTFVRINFYYYFYYVTRQTKYQEGGREKRFPDWTRVFGPDFLLD